MAAACRALGLPVTGATSASTTSRRDGPSTRPRSSASSACSRTPPPPSLRLPPPGLDVWLLGETRVELGGSVQRLATGLEGRPHPRPARRGQPPPPARRPRRPAPPGRRPRPLRRRPRPRPGRSHPGRGVGATVSSRDPGSGRERGRGRRARRGPGTWSLPRSAGLVSESASRVLLAAPPEAADQLRSLARTADVPTARLGATGGDRLIVPGLLDLPLSQLRDAYEGPPRALGGSLTRADSPTPGCEQPGAPPPARSSLPTGGPNAGGWVPARQGTRAEDPASAGRGCAAIPFPGRALSEISVVRATVGEGRRLAGGPHGWVAAGRRGRGGAAGGGGGGSGGGGRGQEQQPRMANTELVGHVAPPQSGGTGTSGPTGTWPIWGTCGRRTAGRPNGVWAISLKDPAKPRPLASFAKFPGSDGEDVWVGAVSTKAFRATWPPSASSAAPAGPGVRRAGAVRRDQPGQAEGAGPVPHRRHHRRPRGGHRPAARRPGAGPGRGALLVQPEPGPAGRPAHHRDHRPRRPRSSPTGTSAATARPRPGASSPPAGTSSPTAPGRSTRGTSCSPPSGRPACSSSTSATRPRPG